MKKPSSVGSRIRERRLFLSTRQSDLAKSVGISPAYLNLIEHDRRRIGGKLLLDIAEALEVEANLLSQGAEAALLSGLEQASAEVQSVEVERDRIEELAGRFPGWAQLILEQQRDVLGLRQAVQTLSDRLSHDPFLSDALHEILSTVTSIQSSASILVESTGLEKEWQDRFQRNIFEDSSRLAHTSQSLVSYLDPDNEDTVGHATPDEEFDRFLKSRSSVFPELEQEDDVEIDQIIEASPDLRSPSAKDLAGEFLSELTRVTRLLPSDRLAALESSGIDPLQMAATAGVSLPDMMLRLAFRDGQGERDYGYVRSDASGAMLVRRTCNGFAIPKAGQACPLWPLYEAFSRPLVPQQTQIRQVGRDGVSLGVLSVAMPVNDFASGHMPRFHSHMLMWGAQAKDDNLIEVGVNCRICTKTDCSARREASILSDGF